MCITEALSLIGDVLVRSLKSSGVVKLQLLLWRTLFTTLRNIKCFYLSLLVMYGKT